MGAEGVTVDKLENAGPALEHAVNAQMNDGKTADRNYKSPIEITPIADASARGGGKASDPAATQAWKVNLCIASGSKRAKRVT